MGEKKSKAFPQIAVLGALSLDRVRRPDGRESEQPGGSVYYASLALAELGWRVLAIPLLAKKETALLDSLRHPRLQLAPQWGETTTSFGNRYALSSADTCQRTLLACGARFESFPREILSCRAVLLLPLCQGEMSLSFYRALRRDFAGLIATDLQGLLRPSAVGEVTLTAAPDLPSFLYQVDMIKGDEAEACAASNIASPAIAGHFLRGGKGHREVVVTAGSRGATIFSTDGITSVPSVPVNKIVDPSGCGDTFLAAYLSGRIKKYNFLQAGTLAAKVAAEKLSQAGAYKKKPRRILASFLRKNS